MVKNPPLQETQVPSLGRDDPLEKERQPTPVFFFFFFLVEVPGNDPGASCKPILQYSCWEIPWTKEPGGLQFMGLQESDTT